MQIIALKPAFLGHVDAITRVSVRRLVAVRVVALVDDSALLPALLALRLGRLLTRGEPVMATKTLPVLEPDT